MGEAPAPGSLQIKVAFDRKEHGAAQWAAMNRGPLLRRPVVILPATVVGGLLIIQLDRVLRPVLHQVIPMPAQAVLAIVMVVVAGIGLKRATRQREEVARHEEHPDVYTLSDAGLEISGAEDLTLMSWSSMTRVHETERFFLFVAGKEVQYLPKRVLYDERLEVVRGLIARYGPGARALPAST